MRALRIVIGLPLAFLALGYMLVGSLFMTGEAPFDSGAGRVLAITGLLGFCAPVVLFGLHLAFSGPDAPRRLRSFLFLALTFTVAVGLGGGLYALVQPGLQADAASMLGTVLISALLFGWVIVRARFFGPDG
ncbi:MAG: hypothetical protein NTW20_08795 [Rhodobacterales bacterium]|nr:hypothetical protein [Rhodobacterales bacterium]